MRLPALSLAPLVTGMTTLSLAATGCTPVRTHQGYIIDTDLVNSVQPGTDNRDSVRATLGTPTFTAQFAKGEGDYYYLARDSRNMAYRNPHAVAQIALDISFDQNGNVSQIRRTGLDRVARLSPYGKTTPTLGRKRSFFQDLFGNIGTVGAAGVGGGDQGGTGGGGRDTP